MPTNAGTFLIWFCSTLKDFVLHSKGLFKQYDYLSIKLKKLQGLTDKETYNFLKTTYGEKYEKNFFNFGPDDEL